MKRVHLLLGVAVAATLAAGCANCPSKPPKKSAGGTISASEGSGGADASDRSDCPSVWDQWYPVRNEPTVDEVNRVFNEKCPGALGWTGVWLGDRWADLLDVFSLNLSFGQGIGVNLHATEFLEAGLNWWEGTSLGMRGRAWGVWDSDEWDRGLGPFYWVELERTPTAGTRNLFNHEYKYVGWDFQENSLNKAAHEDWSHVGGALHVLFIGAEAGVSLLEAADFIAGWLPLGPILGWCGMEQPVWDISRDDTWSQMARELEAEKGLGR